MQITKILLKTTSNFEPWTTHVSDKSLFSKIGPQIKLLAWQRSKRIVKRRLNTIVKCSQQIMVFNIPTWPYPSTSFSTNRMLFVGHSTKSKSFSNITIRIWTLISKTEWLNKHTILKKNCGFWQKASFNPCHICHNTKSHVVIWLLKISLSQEVKILHSNSLSNIGNNVIKLHISMYFLAKLLLDTFLHKNSKKLREKTWDQDMMLTDLTFMPWECFCSKLQLSLPSQISMIREDLKSILKD